MSDFVLIRIDKEDDVIDEELQAKYGSTLSLDLPRINQCPTFPCPYFIVMLDPSYCIWQTNMDITELCHRLYNNVVVHMPNFDVL